MMVSKINNIVRILTESVRYDTVSGMITSGRADELYEAHERIYQMLCEKDTGNLNECIRGTYFL